MEKRDVRIKLKARTIDLLSRDGGETSFDEIEYSTEATLTFDGKVISVSYEESAELGLEDSVTTLLFEAERPNLVNMTRTGKNTASLIFDPENYRQLCAVNAIGFNIEFVIYTRKSQNSVTPDGGGVIDLDYVIEFHGVKSERNIFHLEVIPEAKK